MCIVSTFRSANCCVFAKMNLPQKNTMQRRERVGAILKRALRMAHSTQGSSAQFFLQSRINDKREARKARLSHGKRRVWSECKKALSTRGPTRARGLTLAHCAYLCARPIQVDDARAVGNNSTEVSIDDTHADPYGRKAFCMVPTKADLICG